MIEARLRGIEVVHTDELEWQASSVPGIWRKRLEHVVPDDAAHGDGGARVTSLVKMDPMSRCEAHTHPDGEEILVLDGVFSDATGDYPAGSFLLHPDGFEHAPHSAEGCLLLVKRRQYPGTERTRVALSVDETTWIPHQREEGSQRLELYLHRRYPERTFMVALLAGTTCAPVVHDGGAEIFVLDGDLEDERGSYRTHSWIRLPPGTPQRLRTHEGCTFYLKENHLRGGVPA